MQFPNFAELFSEDVKIEMGPVGQWEGRAKITFSAQASPSNFALLGALQLGEGFRLLMVSLGDYYSCLQHQF